MAQAPKNQDQSLDRKDQQHPLWSRDRQMADRLLQEEPNDYNLAELARLRIRYSGFPGAWDIQTDLDNVLKKWNLTEETLLEKTRQIHTSGQVYKIHSGKREDWN
jgi:hypothetical protein